MFIEFLKHYICIFVQNRTTYLWKRHACIDEKSGYQDKNNNKIYNLKIVQNSFFLSCKLRKNKVNDLFCFVFFWNVHRKEDMKQKKRNYWGDWPCSTERLSACGLDWLRNTYGPCIILAWGRFGNSLTISTRHLAYPPLWWSVYLYLLPSHLLLCYSLLLLRACWAFVKSTK